MILIFAALNISARGQDFTNLNFESAYNLPGNPENGESVPVTNAIPGWAAYGSDGDVALVNIYYVSNNISGFATEVELEGGSLALNGNNLSVGLFNGGSVSQTGLVPNDAEYLQFEANSPLNMELILGGQSLSYSDVSEGSDYNVYSANIPMDMDGQMETVTFFMQDSGNTELDDIEFSSSPVPEPSEYALMGLGGIVFGVYRRFNQTPC